VKGGWLPKETWIPNARDRLAQRRAEKPLTKAGQIWALWPEIKACLDSGQSHRTVRQWLEEDAGLVLSERAFAVYVSRSRRKEAAQRIAVATEVFFRAQDRSSPPQPQPTEQPKELPADERTNVDPASQTLKTLRKRRFDIRDAHQNGDPTKVKLI
jgi:hypothetical protein